MRAVPPFCLFVLFFWLCFRFCLREWGGEIETLPESRQTFEVAAAQTSGPVNLGLTRQTGFFECEHPVIGKQMVISNQPAVASARILGLGWGYILATCRACSAKISINSCRVFLDYAKIKQAKEKLCCHGAFRCPRCSCALKREQ